MRKRKNKQPLWQAVTVVLSVLLPLLMWVVLLFFCTNIQYCGFGMFGWLGAAMTGVGAALLCMELLFEKGEKDKEVPEDGRKRRVRLGLICLTAGVPLTVLAALVLLHPDTEQVISYNMGSFHWINLIMLCVPAYCYARFRICVNDSLRERRISKTRIKKLQKSFFEKWMYTSLHRECDLGRAYRFNMAFIVLLTLTAAEVALLGWVRSMLPVTCMLMIALSVMSAAAVAAEIFRGGGKIFSFDSLFRFVLLAALALIVRGQFEMAERITSGRII